MAQYTTVQLSRVLFLKRDKWGRLLDPRDVLPDGIEVDDRGQRVIPKDRHGLPKNRVAFQKLFVQAKVRGGMTQAQAEDDWDRYVDANPSLAKLVAHEKRRREKSEKRNEARQRQREKRQREVHVEQYEGD